MSYLKDVKRPVIEFNVTEAFISRLLGEFSKQEPSIAVSSEFDSNVDPQCIDVVEGHIRHKLYEANKDNTAYEIYKDLLSGGFSVVKVFTEYANKRSMHQTIRFSRVFDPTLCGWDPMARVSTKSDGEYCFEIYPKSKSAFKSEYPDVDISGISFSRGIDGFNWSYSQEREDVLLVCDYYEKKYRKIKIAQYADGVVRTPEEYEELLERFKKEKRIEQPPIMVGEPRTTNEEYIVRYVFIEGKVIKHEETNFAYLPLVFFDGNSITSRQTINGVIQQFTKPYAFHTRGAQALKNAAGQSLANELENMVQHKIMVAEEAIPAQYIDAYTDVQTPSVLVYKAFKDNDPQVALPPPQMIPRPPIPGEIMGAFQMADNLMQTILGSYDASLGIQNNQLSGVAIVEGATQSNSAAMPYIVGFLAGLNQVAQIMLDLIPKYYTTPRTIPIIGKDGKNTYVKINSDDGIALDYDENVLNVSVEAGVNFAIQKSRALSQIIGLMQASPTFAQFMNTEGLPELLDNVEIRGIDKLKLKAEKYQEMIMQQQQQAAQNPQPNPLMVRAQADLIRAQNQGKQFETESKIKAAQLGLEEQRLHNDLMKFSVANETDEKQQQIQMRRDETARMGKAVDIAIQAADMSHRHAHDAHRLTQHVQDRHMDRSVKLAEHLHKIHEASESPLEEEMEHS
jgi:hypothetical protein